MPPRFVLGFGAGIDPDADVELVVYPRRRSIYEALTAQFGASAGGWSLLAGRAERQALAALTALGRETSVKNNKTRC